MAEDDEDQHEEPEAIAPPAGGGEDAPQPPDVEQQAVAALKNFHRAATATPPRTPPRARACQASCHQTKVSSLSDIAFFTTGGRLNLTLLPNDLPSNGNTSITPNSVGSPVQEARALQAKGLGVATVLQKIQKWGDYASYGDVIRGSRIIPMKTPLTTELQKGYLPRHDGQSPREFTLKIFLDDQRTLGREVGLIVDLSNHDCLYRSDLPDNVEYRHFIFVAKRLPDPENCRKVREAINDYLARNPGHHVAVHCSYGFNRTGFVCCSYLIEQLHYTVDEALEAFQDSRPPGVKHKDFIEELRARYGEGARGSLDQEDVDKDGYETPVLLHNYADVNNESLGYLTGPMVKAELERELTKLADAGYKVDEGRKGKECTIS